MRLSCWKEKRRARDEAANGWDLSPITTARLAAETWNAIKAEPWSLAVSDRIPWARRLWPATEYHHMLGGSGAQGVGYAAPASLGVALSLVPMLASKLITHRGESGPRTRVSRRIMEVSDRWFNMSCAT